MIFTYLEPLTIIFAAAYLLLAFLLFLRRVETNTLVTGGLLFLATSALWQWSMIWFAGATWDLHLPTAVLGLLSAYFLAFTTAAYLEKPVPLWVLVLTVGTAAAAIVITAVMPSLAPPQLGLLRLQPQAGQILAYLMGIGLMVVVYVWTIQGYRRTPFPWHANRYLYWSIIILFLLAGTLLHIVENPWVMTAGFLLRFLAATGFAYGISTYIRFDVRARFRRLLTLAILFTLALVPAVGLYYLIQLIVPSYPPLPAAFLSAGAIALVWVIIAPSYHNLENLIYRLFIGEAFKEATALREYNQAIAGALEIESLAAAIIDQLNHLFGVSRGALVLALEDEQDGQPYYLFEPIPAAGEIPVEAESFSKANPFVNLLLRTPQPLLQYEIDYNPVFAPIRQEAHTWLKGLEMEIYAPIRSGQSLKGFITLGPKRSGYTYRANELDLIQLIADQTTAALENATLYRELGNQNDKVRQLNDSLVRQNERLEMMDKVKSDFITIASHELRTPLTQVKGYTDILASLNEENALTRDQTRQIINQIERATENLEQLISAMLDASQIDVDEMKLNMTQTKVGSALRLALEPLSQAIRQRRLTLQMDVDDALPAIEADFKRLVQALTNIMGNAVKFTPDQGRITVTARPIEGDHEQFVEIAVTDTGIGIDSAYHQLIFEKFFRLGDPHLHSTGATKFMGGGPGLGLTIARGVVEGHGGRIWVESAGEDRERLPGTTVTIILPVKHTPFSLRAKLPAPPHAQATATKAESPESQPEPLIGR